MPEGVSSLGTPFPTQAAGGVAQTSTAIDIFEFINQGGKTKEVIKMLQETHPKYQEFKSLWVKMRDVALNLIDSESEKKAYLIKGESEPKPFFDMRIALSAFLPETPNLLSDFIGAVFSKAAKREISKDIDPITSDNLQAFMDAAGPEQQPLTIMAERALNLALVYGSVDGVLDHAAARNEDDPGTAVPILSLLTPLQRLDWDVNRDGNYKWVKYIESFDEKDTWNGPRRHVDEYRIFTAPFDGVDSDGDMVRQSGMIFLFRITNVGQQDQEIKAFPPVAHDFPTVPIRTLFWDRQAPGIGNPWVKPMVEADTKIFRAESDVTWDIFVHAHPWIIAWLHNQIPDTASNSSGSDGPGTGGALDRIKLGTAWATMLDPGGEERQREDIQYLAPITAELQLQLDAIKDDRDRLRRFGGSGPEMQQAQAAKPESGVALAYRNAQRSKNFIRGSRALQEWEWQLNELIVLNGREEKKDIQDIIQVQYPQEFDQRLTDELHEDLESAQKIGSPTLIAEVKKMLAIRLIGDGATAEMVQKINEQIEGAPVAEGVEGTEVDEDGRPRIAAVAPEDETIEFNELTLAVERLTRLGDLELVNAIRGTIADRLGVARVRDLTTADLAEAHGSLAPEPISKPPDKKPKAPNRKDEE